MRAKRVGCDGLSHILPKNELTIYNNSKYLSDMLQKTSGDGFCSSLDVKHRGIYPAASSGFWPGCHPTEPKSPLRNLPSISHAGHCCCEPTGVLRQTMRHWLSNPVQTQLEGSPCGDIRVSRNQQRSSKQVLQKDANLRSAP